MIRAWLTTLLCCITFSSHANQLYIEPTDGITPVLTLINHAKQSINITMYGFTEQRILSALIAAHARGVSINIILEPSPYKAHNENTKAIQTLKQNRITVLQPNHKFTLTHQKSMLIDNHTAAILTGNFTYGAFTYQRNFIYITNDSSIINEMNRQFMHDSQATPFSPSMPQLIWSPDNSREKLTGIIQDSKDELDIYAQAMNDYRLAGILAKKASTSNTAIQLLLPNNAKKHDCDTLTYLKQHQVHIKILTTPYIHAKAMIQDKSNAFIGSINLTHASLDKNRELGILINKPELVNKLANQFNSDWKAASEFSTC